MIEILDTILDSFRSVVGDDFVVVDRKKCVEYEKTTFVTNNKIPAIIYPGSTSEIQQCIEIANKYMISVYPISTGKNIGYGSRVPSSDSCVILELSRMNKIIELNEDLGFVTLEPGVTQRQLYEFLQTRKSNFWMDATGSTEAHSIIGNIAERGFGHTPYGDHFGNVGGMEVVLANGDIIHTGLGRFPNAKAKGVYRWGLGPYLDGLFTQSNLGIITQVTVWLMPAPEYYEYFYFSFERHDQIAEIINLLRPLRLNGTIKSAVHIANDYKVLSSIQLYPWDKTQGKVPLTQDILDQAAKSWDFGAWNGYSALYGTRQEVLSAKKKIKKQLNGKVKKIRFLNDSTIKVAELIQKPYHYITGINLPEMLKILKPVYFLTKGIPSDKFIESTYWRIKDGVPANMDPDADSCGLLWCAPIAPIDGIHAAAIWHITKPIFEIYGFEPMISITLLTERSLSSVITIAYDRNIAGEDQKAMVCHDQLLKKLTDEGYYPYRQGIQSLGKLAGAEASYMRLLKSLKAALDPNNILAPGRYDL
jgi:4-cresol dehydrogenase (hydroxylating) flavoprotein subunit